ncbi:MAG: hypothetical protein ACYC6T_16585 [Thermoleophilia bacterium]
MRAGPVPPLALHSLSPEAGSGRGATHLVTAERVMVVGAEELGFRVTRFD